MSRLKALIVDDEHKAVELLHQLLMDTRQFSEVKSAYSARDAKTTLQSFQPDLIFLDIKMPGMDGFALLEDLQDDDQPGDVIFTTAYEEYALRAIKKHAFDYLLKPIDRKELYDCIVQYKERKQGNNIVEKPDRWTFSV